MPKIPDFEQLGSRPTPTPQRGVYGYTPGIVADAQLEQAKDLGRLSQTIDKGLKEENEIWEKLQMSQAHSSLLRARADAINQVSQQPDYENARQNYDQLMTKAKSDIAQGIKDTRVRSLFEAQADEHIAPGLLHVDSIVENKRDDAQYASVLQTAHENLKVAAQTNDPGMAQQLRTLTANSVMDWGKAKGQQVRATQLLESLDKEYAKNWAVNLLQSNPTKLQQILDQSFVGGPSNSDAAIDYVIKNFEGSKLVPQDGNKGASKYGINQTANPGVDVANLTEEQAKKIYKEKYWDAINADSLPENVRLAAFDTAVNFGPDTAKKMLAVVGNDPQKLAQLRQAEHARLIQSDPETYAKYAKAWEQRDIALSGTKTGTPIDGLDPVTRQELFHASMAMQEQMRRQQQEAAKAQQEAQRDVFLKQTYDKTLKITDVLNNNILTSEQKEHVIDTMNKVGKETDPNVFNDILFKIHSTGSDRIDEQGKILDYVGKGINYQDYKNLSDELAGKHNPDNEMLKNFDKMARESIAGKGIFDMPDPEAEKQYYNWWVYTRELIKKKTAQGVSLSALLTDGSKEYIGGSIKDYTRPLKDRMESALKDVGQTLDINTPQGLVEAVRSGKMSREEGNKEAIKRGWAREVGPSVPVSR